MPKINKSFIESLKPGLLGDQCHWDAELPGFGVRVQASGRKVFVVRYRTIEGVQRKQNVAPCGIVTADKARELARKIFGHVAEGKDPRAERAAARKEAATMEDLQARYMSEYAVPPNKKPASIASDEKNWRLHVLPVLKGRRVDAITQSDVSAVLARLQQSPSTANQCIALLSKAFGLAQKWGMRTRGGNPAQGLKKHAIAEKELILTYAQIAALERTLDTMTADGRVRPEYAAFIRLLVLTGCRKSEIMAARRAWVDVDRGLLLLPDSKTGEKKVALSAEAIAVVQALPADPDGWLVPGRVKGQPLKEPYRIWEAIKAAAGLPEALRLHDLRHTAGSLAHMNGATQLEVAKMLGHKQLRTTERYLHGFASDAARTASMLGKVIATAQTA